MNPGETLSVAAGDRVITITRTKRPYVFDLADAYNAGREGKKHRWHVVGRDLRFGDPNWRDEAQWRECLRANDDWSQQLRFGAVDLPA